MRLPQPSETCCEALALGTPAKTNTPPAKRPGKKRVSIGFPTAAIKPNSRRLRIILLLSSLYSFYHGKITCNIRLYLQFHFYKMSLQDVCWFKNSRLNTKKTKTQHTHSGRSKANCNTHINKYRHSLTASPQEILQPRTYTIPHFHTQVILSLINIT